MQCYEVGHRMMLRNTMENKLRKERESTGNSVLKGHRNIGITFKSINQSFYFLISYLLIILFLKAKKLHRYKHKKDRQECKLAKRVNVLWSECLKALKITGIVT